MTKRLAQIQDDLLTPLAPDERDQLTRLLIRVLDHHTRESRPGDDTRAGPDPQAGGRAVSR